MSAIAHWFRERLPISQKQIFDVLDEPVPNHLRRWWFCLGGTPAYLFVVQIFTGILLAFYYQPGATTAYDSVNYITNEASYGWYFRSVHKWAATGMIAAVVLHQMRVYFTGAYRKPREINWMIGMCLLMATLLTGFTGYSLVFEQLSYWGATVAANICDTVPVVGHFAKQMLLAGETYNNQTLPRFYILHAAVLPATIILLLVVHVAILRVQGVTEFRFEDEPPGPARHFPFFPDHMCTELMTFRWLKLFSGTVAVLSTGLIIFVMFVWPFIDAAIRKHTRFAEASVWIGILGASLIIGLTVWEAAVEH
ncbi:MAG: cytochrome b N-terminal domain-containing protein [Planctomycetota bacterium]|nr:cytochrome b N-terminal domain-containing protein [Planctomycetota bacterium]